MLRLWYRSLGHETDPIHVLQDSLVSVGADPGIGETAALVSV